MLGYDVYKILPFNGKCAPLKKVFNNLTYGELQEKTKLILESGYSVKRVLWDGRSHDSEWIDIEEEKECTE